MEYGECEGCELCTGDLDDYSPPPASGDIQLVNQARIEPLKLPDRRKAKELGSSRIHQSPPSVLVLDEKEIVDYKPQKDLTGPKVNTRNKNARRPLKEAYTLEEALALPGMRLVPYEEYVKYFTMLMLTLFRRKDTVVLDADGAVVAVRLAPGPQLRQIFKDNLQGAINDLKDDIEAGGHSIKPNKRGDFTGVDFGYTLGYKKVRYGDLEAFEISSHLEQNPRTKEHLGEKSGDKSEVREEQGSEASARLHPWCDGIDLISSFAYSE